jgi:hypothetical protein
VFRPRPFFLLLFTEVPGSRVLGRSVRYLRWESWAGSVTLLSLASCPGSQNVVKVEASEAHTLLYNGFRP